jgi:hypothetical protein
VAQELLRKLTELSGVGGPLDFLIKDQGALKAAVIQVSLSPFLIGPTRQRELITPIVPDW